MEPEGEIFVVPFFGLSHVFPCMELCRLFCSIKFKTTLIISSDLTSAIPNFLLNRELFGVAEFPTPLPPPPRKGSIPDSGPDPLQVHFQEMGDYIESLLGSRSEKMGSTRPVFALVDSMMCWSKEIFMKFGLQVVMIFTCGAASIALEHAAWIADVENLKPGETRILPGLPKCMAFSYSDLTLRRNGHPDPSAESTEDPNQSIQPVLQGPPRKKRSFPTEPGDEPAWVEATNGAVAFLINTCDELERPFIDYISAQIGVPVWGVGPLLPQEYWKYNATTILEETKPKPDPRSNYSEEQIIKWLDTKPRRSVIYISFGTYLSPELGELEEIAKALEEMDQHFIWVLQTGSEVLFEYYPEGLGAKVGDRGLIIHGWAPQLLILNHASVRGFLTHCGWNSTMEAIGLGIPMLAWPIKGDQFYNAKAIESQFRIGYVISKRDEEADDGFQIVRKDVIIHGIERLMTDGEVQERAETLSNQVCKHDFPASSLAGLDAFKGFISQIAMQ